jgi:GNAT superfamily N-acetyltransferase
MQYTEVFGIHLIISDLFSDEVQDQTLSRGRPQGRAGGFSQQCAGPFPGLRRGLAALGEVVAFGGYELSSFYDLGTLVFGLVRADRHGAGIGRALLHYRLLHMAGRRQRPRWVTVDTHPHTAGFFERCGFEAIARWPGGYRSGRDRIDLRFELSDEAVETLRAAG